MSTKEQIENIKSIKEMMERSSRYMTLSGFASIFAGIYAIVGAVIGYFWVYQQQIKWDEHFHLFRKYNYDPRFVLFGIALVVFLFAVGTAIYLTRKKAKKTGLSIWNSQAKRVIYQFAIPLVAGGLFCILLILHNEISLVASASLIFYGLALLNASKFTFNETHQFAIAQIVLGLLAGVFLCYGIVFWTIGFGLFHIIFGIVIYIRYEKEK
jgi:hypothetical protein